MGPAAATVAATTVCGNGRVVPPDCDRLARGAAAQNRERGMARTLLRSALLLLHAAATLSSSSASSLEHALCEKLPALSKKPKAPAKEKEPDKPLFASDYSALLMNSGGRHADELKDGGEDDWFAACDVTIAALVLLLCIPTTSNALIPSSASCQFSPARKHYSLTAWIFALIVTAASAQTCDYYSFNGCPNCPPGQGGGPTYSGHYSDCGPCQDGYYNTGNSFSCSLCPAGQVAALNHITCVNCPAGSYTTTAYNTGTFANPNWYYSNQAARCTPCPLGTASSVSGSSSIADCVTCPPGTFSTGNAAVCAVCPAGTYFPGAGAVFCLPCPPGTFSSATNMISAATCIPCPAGTFSPSAAAACSPCPPGTYSLAGVPACLLCPAGTYGASAGLKTNACSGLCASCGEGSASLPPTPQMCTAAGSRAVPTSLGVFVWPASNPSNPQQVDLIIAPLALCLQLGGSCSTVATNTVVGADGVTRYIVGTAAALNLEAAEELTCGAQ